MKTPSKMTDAELAAYLLQLRARPDQHSVMTRALIARAKQERRCRQKGT